MTDRTFDYDGESAAPRPVSQTVEKYLRKSFSLADLFGRLLRGWFLALLGAVAGAVIGLYVVWITPPSYAVTITLLPLDSGSADLSGGGGTGLGIIAGLLGANGPVPKFTRFVASFYTTGLASAMDRKYDTICTVFNCNKKTHTWPKSTGFYAWINRTVKAIEHLPSPDHPRTAVDLAQYIANNVIITSDSDTRMLELSMNTTNPATASTFLLDLVHTANDYIKDQDNAVVKKEIAYITEQLRSNTNLEQRDALTKMLADQEQHLMLTAIDLPYVASIQDGPTVQSNNSAVRYLAAFVLFGFLIGGGLGIAISYVPEHKRFWSRSWKPS